MEYFTFGFKILYMLIEIPFFLKNFIFILSSKIYLGQIPFKIVIKVDVYY